MALSAGRVGVNRKSVDYKGNVKGGSGGASTAENVSYSDTYNAGVTNVQSAIDVFSGGVKLGIDGDGNRGYYKADDSFIPFKETITDELNYTSYVQEGSTPSTSNFTYSMKNFNSISIEVLTARAGSIQTYCNRASLYVRYENGTSEKLIGALYKDQTYDISSVYNDKQVKEVVISISRDNTTYSTNILLKANIIRK